MSQLANSQNILPKRSTIPNPTDISFFTAFAVPDCDKNQIKFIIKKFPYVEGDPNPTIHEFMELADDYLYSILPAGLFNNPLDFKVNDPSHVIIRLIFKETWRFSQSINPKFAMKYDYGDCHWGLHGFDPSNGDVIFDFSKAHKQYIGFYTKGVSSSEPAHGCYLNTDFLYGNDPDNPDFTLPVCIDPDIQNTGGNPKQ